MYTIEYGSNSITIRKDGKIIAQSSSLIELLVQLRRNAEVENGAES
jgi:hypothetical protein